MATKDFLFILTWGTLAFLLIALGLYRGRKQDRHYSRIFERGNEWYAQAYSDCIIAVERQWAERQRT